MDMNLQKYIAFVKAVELRSFSKAADALHYSQSGISRMIQDLETQWGVTLLERSRGGIRLTSEGLSLLPRAQSLVAEYRKLQATVGSLQKIETGVIRIGTFSSVATHWLPNIIQAFQQDYPNIQYELLLGDYREIERWILEGRVDCGFLRLPVHPELESVFLEEDPLMAVVPEGHPLCKYKKIPGEALSGYPFMLLERGEAKSEVADLLAEHAIRPDVRFTTWDDYAILAMVECGLGISILPRLILKRITYKVVIRPLSIPAKRRICLAMRDPNGISPAVTRFMGYLKFRECSTEADPAENSRCL